MKNLLLKQIDFEIWANNLLFEAMQKTGELESRSLLLFSHLISSYDMWLSRIKATEIKSTLFQERSLAECSAVMKNVLPQLKEHLSSADEQELNRIITFNFPLDGSKRKLSVKDAILHLVTHSCYHRGQIITSLKGKIDPLPLTTYIAFAMEKG